MKSNTCDLTKQGGGLSCILLEVEKSAVYNELNQKQTLQLRLLAEELVGMLPELLKNYEGRFWLESEAQEFKLHVALSAPEIDFAQHQNLLAVSTSGKNAAATGIMGKVRAAAESLLLYADSPDVAPTFIFANTESPDMTFSTSAYYAYTWTLEQYKKQVQQEKSADAWDELEKSIVARLADDVLVGIKGKHVDIIVQKAFA